MKTVEELPVLKSIGRLLDTSPAAFGELRDSSVVADDVEALRERFEEDGYLFLRRFWPREDVLAARAVLVNQLAAEGILETGSDPMDAVVRKGASTYFRPELANRNQPLQELLYTGALMEFYRGFFGEEVRHYDFTWLRTVMPGKGTHPHADVVYMGRGERQQLMTAWVPLGDAPLDLGGLMVLEGSHRQQERLRRYLERDVDTYCTNGRNAAEVEQGKKGGDWSGTLAKDPVSLRDKLGGRWLTADFEAGDLLTFKVQLVHGSLDNGSSDRLRFSSDSRYQPASRPADERWIGPNPPAHGLAAKRGRIC